MPEPSPHSMLDLSGRVVIVTGSAGGLATGIAQRLTGAGATVVGTDRPGTDADLALDLTDPRAPAQITAAVLDQHGRIDGLVNAAGIQDLVPFDEVADSDWSDMIEVNLTAAHRLAQAVASGMPGGGSVVHIASIEARHPTLEHGHYSVAKAALVAHARSAALAYGPRGIRVNTVSPGLISRPGIADQWPEGVERWTSTAPLGRLGTPDDIGDACLFLISDLSRWITGIDLVVDGGVLTGPTW